MFPPARLSLWANSSSGVPRMLLLGPNRVFIATPVSTVASTTGLPAVPRFVKIWITPDAASAP